MKKILAIIVLSSLLLTGCSLRVAIDSVDSVLATAPELQRVESHTYLIYRETTEYADNREEEKSYDYDNRNHLISCTYYSNGEKLGVDTYTTDEFGNILTVTPDDPNGDFRVSSYTYGESGNILTEEATLNGILDYTISISYNEAGIIQSKVIAHANGHRTEYYFDSLGRETECSEYTSQTLQTRTVTEYADHGKRHKVTIYDGSGNVTGWTDFQFNPTSSKETILEYAGDGTLLQQQIATYDIHDQLMMLEVLHPDGTPISTTYRHIVQHTLVDYVEITEPTQ